MQPYRDLAIVLRSIPYEERHRVVTALTEQNGMISALAKNAIQSRRFGGTLEIFAASEWHFTRRPGAELVTLTEAHIREPFEGIRTQFDQLALGSVLNEFLLRLAPHHQACPELFRLHSNALATLSSGHATGFELALLNAYLAKLLQWSGSQPRLMGCLRCDVSLEAITGATMDGAMDGAVDGAMSGTMSGKTMHADTMRGETELSCVIADAGWLRSQCRSVDTRHLEGTSFPGQKFQHSFLRLSADTLRCFQLYLRTPIRQVPQLPQVKPSELRTLFQFLEGLLIYHVPGFDRQPIQSLRFIRGLEPDSDFRNLGHQSFTKSEVNGV